CFVACNPYDTGTSCVVAFQICPFAGLFSRLRGYSLGKARAFERSAMLPYRIGVFGRESTSRSFLGFLPRCPLFLVSGSRRRESRATPLARPPSGWGQGAPDTGASTRVRSVKLAKNRLLVRQLESMKSMA